MAHSLHVKKGDLVRVIAGDDRGTVGEIISVDPKAQKVVVQGVNVVKKHTPNRPNAQGKTTGGIVTAEAPIHVSNVQLVTKVDGKEVLTRVGYERRPATKRRPDGTTYEAERSVRVARKTGKEI
jgi:large subunit ribosomal protein L24